MHARPTVAALLLPGVAGLGALVGRAVAGEPGVLVPAVLPVAFLAAGLVGTLADPRHLGVRLLLAVGSLHLVAFGQAAWLPAGPGFGGGAWAATVVGSACFTAGFAALSLVLAGYPDVDLRRPYLRRFAALVLGVWSFAVLSVALLSPALPPALERGGGEVPAPAGLPLATLPVDPQAALPLLVVAGAVVLVARARRTGTQERQAMRWATLAAAVIALLLLASPLAEPVLPEEVWATMFLAGASTVPFLLLAGLLRHRLPAVDLLLVRTLTRGLLAVAVLAAYALVAAASADLLPVAVVVTLVAALTGGPVLRRVERLADRWVTGGRLRRESLLRHLEESAADGAADRLPHLVCTGIAEALDVRWVRLVDSAGTHATTGAPATAPEVEVPVRHAGVDVGVLQLGPRRGGWDRTRCDELAVVVARCAPSLHAARLSAELAARVEELTRSRARLVQAEQTVRRQVERDLHDGVQQQLVALLARLAVARRLAGPDGPVVEVLDAARSLAADTLQDLRHLVTGIHPALLDDQGLVAAVAARADLLPVDVVLDADPRVSGARWPAEVERAAYFVVSEALANVSKHSGSPRARVVLSLTGDDGLRVAVADEGCGTATYAGSGLVGLRDRVETLGGSFVLQSLPGVGTTVVAELPGSVVREGVDA